VSLALDSLGLLGAIGASAGAARLAARPLLDGLARAERWAWALALGLSADAAIDLAAVRLGIRPGPWAIFGGVAILAAAGFALARRSPPLPERRPAGWAAAALVLAALAVVLFGLVALSEPMWSNDFLAIWGFKAKTIFLSGGIPSRLFFDPASAWSHPEYPLWLPAVFAALSAGIGRWDDQALAILYPVLQAATAAALYGWTKRRFSPGPGAAAALLCAAFLPLYQGFEVGMAEVPLALALVLFGAAALDFSERPAFPAAARLALSAFLAASIKREGLLFALVAGVWLAVREMRRRRAISVLALTAVPAVLHELLLLGVRGRIADRDYDLALLRPDRWIELARRAGDAAGHLVRPGDAATWTAILAVAAFAALARPARGVPALALLAPPLLAQGAAYVAVCALSAFDPVWQVSFVPRLLCALFPLALLAVAPRLAWAVEGARSDRVAGE